MRLTLPLRKLHKPVTAVLVGWPVGRAGMIAVPAAAVNSPHTSTDFGVSYFLLEKHLTVYYTVFEFYEDRHRAARRVFAEMTYCFRYTPRFSRLVGQKPPGFWIETCVTRFPWHTATKSLRAALK